MTLLVQRLVKLEIIIAGIFVIAMVIMVFVGGTSRLMRSPINATIDFATCFFAWATFLSADIAWRQNRLTSLRLLPDALPKRWSCWLDLGNYAVILAILGYGVVAGTWLAWISRTRTFQGMPDISYSWVTASLPVGCALMAVTTLAKIWQHVKSMREDATGGQS
jgi:TRAP-type C4-dicarboxylate transport system permease small subunit